MRGYHLSTEQLERLTKALYSKVNYLARLNARAEKMLEPDDALRVKIKGAYDAALDVAHHVHSLTVQRRKER